MSEVTVEPPKSLRSFCTRVVDKCSAQWPPDETKMAWEFVTYFGLPPLPSLKDYEALAAKLAIELAVAPLPSNLRGYNCRFNDKDLIVIDRLQGPADHAGLNEHTFLHELRELIEYEFRREQRPTATGHDLEYRAESFATAVRGLAPWPHLGSLVDSALQIKSGWKYAALGAIFGFGLMNLLVCFFLPHHEEYLRNLGQ